jgi:hypothetical protein
LLFGEDPSINPQGPEVLDDRLLLPILLRLSPGDGGLAERATPETGTENTIDVGSVDDFVAKIESNGGKITRPKSAVPGVGWLAYCQDTEGNTFSIMQSDPPAK